MFCRHCSTSLPEDAKFCPGCAKPVDTGTGKSNPKDHTSIILTVIALVILIPVLTIWIVKQFPNQPTPPPVTPTGSTPNASPSSPTAQAPEVTPVPTAVPTYTPTAHQIFNALNDVQASQVRWFPFTMPVTGRVTGDFRAHGGNKNDISVGIILANQVENLKNNNALRYYYYTPSPMTTDQINIVLPPGDYLFFLDNRTGWVQRTVEMRVTVEY